MVQVHPENTTDNVYLVVPSDCAQALSAISVLLDQILPKKRLVISRLQETSKGLIVRIPNENTRFIESCIQLSDNHFHGYKVEPDIQAIIDLNRETGIGSLAGLPLSQRVDSKTVHEHYLAYLQELKRRLSTPEMKKCQRNRKVAEERRISSITGAVNEALSLCKRARLVRIDGNYLQSVRGSITPEIITSDLDRLIGNMRNNSKQFNALVLAVFKIEYGPKKGYHWHGYFIYDGDLVRQDVLRGKYLLDYWCNVITKGKGSGYNVNAMPARKQLADRLKIPVKHLALGEFLKGDAIQAENIAALIQYFGKSSQRIRVVESKRIRLLRIVRGPRFIKLKR